MYHQDMEFGQGYGDPGETYWYENDLELAAELGKTLLERNKDLESQLKHSQQIQFDQAREIDLLVKQLDVLRNVNDSRMRIYEEVDRNLQELEKTNTSFRHEIKADKIKIKSFTGIIDSLEGKCAELTTKLEELRKKEKQRKKNDRQRQWNSFPDLVVESTASEFRGNFDYLGFPSIFDPLGKRNPVDNEHLRQTKETLRKVQQELAKEQQKREEAESNVRELMKEKRELHGKVEKLEQDQEELAMSEQESGLVTDSRILSQIMCRSCKSAASETSSIADAELLEHDLEELPRGEVVRLKCGGSAYGSRESLHMIGLEADDYLLETGSDILVSGNLGDSDDDPNSDEIKSPGQSVSLLGELEAQYRKLVRKYERLIEAKSQRAAKEASTQDNLEQEPEVNADGVKMRQKNPSANREVQTTWRQSFNLDLKSPVDPIQGHFENGPPEYKRLFKEIFDTLQRSATFEDDMNTQLDNLSSVSSPEEGIGLGEKSG